MNENDFELTKNHLEKSEKVTIEFYNKASIVAINYEIASDNCKNFLNSPFNLNQELKACFNFLKTKEELAFLASEYESKTIHDLQEQMD